MDVFERNALNFKFAVRFIKRSLKFIHVTLSHRIGIMSTPVVLDLTLGGIG